MKNFDIQYFYAAVIHANKYNENNGIYLFHFFFSTLLQDIAFKMEDDGEEYHCTVKNLNLPIYTGQQIKLISVNTVAVAYIDKRNNEFYYLSKNLQRDLNVGLKINWTSIIVSTFLALLISSFFFQLNVFYSYFALLIPFSFWIYQFIMNFLVERKIDRLIIKV